MKVLFGRDPALLEHLSVTDLVENAVACQIEKVELFRRQILTSKEKEVHVIVDVEFLDVRGGHHNVRVAAELLALRLDVSKGSRDREPAWEHAVRPINDVGVLFSVLVVARKDCAVVLAWLVGDGLDRFLSIAPRDRLCLIYSASVG